MIRSLNKIKKRNGLARYGANEVQVKHHGQRYDIHQRGHQITPRHQASLCYVHSSPHHNNILHTEQPPNLT
jgi:hypothetical protein